MTLIIYKRIDEFSKVVRNIDILNCKGNIDENVDKNLAKNKIVQQIYIVYFKTITHQ